MHRRSRTPNRWTTNNGGDGRRSRGPGVRRTIRTRDNKSRTSAERCTRGSTPRAPGQAPARPQLTEVPKDQQENGTAARPAALVGWRQQVPERARYRDPLSSTRARAVSGGSAATASSRPRSPEPRAHPGCGGQRLMMGRAKGARACRPPYLCDELTGPQKNGEVVSQNRYGLLVFSTNT